MRAVGGRLKSDYRYTPGLVYNTFPWPEPTDEMRSRIELRAKAVLAARETHPGCSYADLYGKSLDVLFPDLAAAHHELDVAVEAAYGVEFGSDEEKIVTHLLKLYAEKVGE